MPQSTRQQAIEIFHHALQHATLEAAVADAVFCDATVFRIRDVELPLAAVKNIYLIAIGKGAAPLFSSIRSLLPPHIPVSSIITAPIAPDGLTSSDQYFHGGHPQPNAASLHAAQAALNLLATADESTLVLFLITGGASAMFELPISTNITLADLIELNRILVAGGAPISEINAVRKHLSAVKGGRLALALAAASPTAAHLTLLVSDVPANALDALASGPTLADHTTVTDCLAVLDTYHLRESLPASIRQQLTTLPETPKQVPAKYPPVLLLDNNHLLHQAADHAASLGYHVVIDNSTDDWDATEAATSLLNHIRNLPHDGRPLCLLCGGEVTVTLPHNLAANAEGGRNQHFALACAMQLNADENITVLSAGSDGIDGNSPAAGAVADETTQARAAALGLHPQAHFEDFNSYQLFKSLDDAILTGPTNNNLRDLRILLRP